MPTASRQPSIGKSDETHVEHAPDLGRARPSLYSISLLKTDSARTARNSIELVKHDSKSDTVLLCGDWRCLNRTLGLAVGSTIGYCDIHLAYISIFESSCTALIDAGCRLRSSILADP